MTMAMKMIMNKIHSFFKGISKQEVKWEEFEAEIDDQVNAVFNVAEEMDAFTDAQGITEEFNMEDSSQMLSSFRKIDELNEMMNKRREAQKRTLSSKLFFLLVFLVSLFVTNFLVPKSLQGAKKSVGLASETYSMIMNFVTLVKSNHSIDADGGGSNVSP